MKILSETDKAYIAGLVDGEGCIQVSRCKKEECIHPYNLKNSKHNNLITLCQKCHAITNGDREYWKGELSGKVY